uniref:EGF-like domain-containing protein n=1 Tax=Lutzomyia longipalpis TaxID=7200 RepID=A0A1B0GGT4_LUTLO
DLETSQASQTEVWETHIGKEVKDPNSRDHNHERVERSASPIVNDISAKPELKHMDDNNVESTASGRPPNTPSINATPTSQAVVPETITTTTSTQKPGGIVKLLNGNVNVHANTQVTRRPIATRINNRGPPRISDAQPVADFDATPTSSLRPPPPYPFDRPEGPVRPFLTGVPIPEQIVPSMQQSYRPGFISQNRPPWQRPRPRPPLGSNQRRPIPPYKPMPLSEQLIPGNGPPTVQPTTTTTTAVVSIVESNATETNLDVNTYEVAVESSEGEINREEEATAEDMPVKKEELSKKKDKPKGTEKKPVIPVTPFESTISTEMASIVSSSSDTEVSLPTISTSKVTQIQETSSISLESSITEIPVPVTVSTETLESLAPETTSATSTTGRIEISSSEIDATSTQPAIPYHPRPGIVLDDPEFKPGQGRPRPSPRPSKPHPYIPNTPQHQAAPPPGYGEIFDVTLSAIQGPTGGTSGVQTVNIKPFGVIGSGDIIVSPTGDEGFVSIDGKRTYINLFGEPTEAPTATTKVATNIKPTPTIQPGQTGTGYAVAETEAVKLPPPRPHYRPRPQQQQPPVRIDTCIVGDDSTCDQAQNEKCKTDNGVSSCHCRPGHYCRCCE